jgi:hypothetical protein
MGDMSFSSRLRRSTNSVALPRRPMRWRFDNQTAWKCFFQPSIRSDCSNNQEIQVQRQISCCQCLSPRAVALYRQCQSSPGVSRGVAILRWFVLPSAYMRSFASSVRDSQPGKNIRSMKKTRLSTARKTASQDISTVAASLRHWC